MGSNPRQQWVTIATGITPCLGQTSKRYTEVSVPIKARKIAHVPGFAPAHAHTPAPPHAGRRDATDDATGSLSGGSVSNVVDESEENSQPAVSSSHLALLPKSRGRVRVRGAYVRELYSTRAPADAPPRETGQSALETMLTDESIGRMAGSFLKINPLLDEPWLREAIRAVQAEFGTVPEAHMRRAIRATFDYCARRLPTPYGTTGHVGFPRAFAITVLKAEVKRTPPH